MRSLTSVLLLCMAFSNAASAAMIRYIVGYLDEHGHPQHFSRSQMIQYSNQNAVVSYMSTWSNGRYVARHATDSANHVLVWNVDPAPTYAAGMEMLNDMKAVISANNIR